MAFVCIRARVCLCVCVCVRARNTVAKGPKSEAECACSRGLRVSDATVPNEAMRQRAEPGLISLVYLQQASQKYPQQLLVQTGQK